MVKSMQTIWLTRTAVFTAKAMAFTWEYTRAVRSAHVTK